MGPVTFLRALRPHQWSKNVFVLAPWAFAAAERESAMGPGAGGRLAVALGAFCLTSSAVYLLNDVCDVEKDKNHPEKRHRPIASGAFPVPAALLTAVLLFLGSLAAVQVFGGGLPVVSVLVAYGALNVAYSLRLKRVVLLDAFCVATGFLLRLAAGGRASGAEVSHWAFLCTLFLALFLALNKRRAEIVLLGSDGAEHRPTLGEYTVGFLDQMVAVLAACTVVAYTMYTVDEGTMAKFEGGHRLVWTVPFVLFGVGRYMVLVQSRGGGGNPTRIFLGGDFVFLLNTLAWLGVALYALYGGA